MWSVVEIDRGHGNGLVVVYVEIPRGVLRQMEAAVAWPVRQANFIAWFAMSRGGSRPSRVTGCPKPTFISGRDLIVYRLTIPEDRPEADVWFTAFRATVNATETLPDDALTIPIDDRRAYVAHVPLGDEVCKCVRGGGSSGHLKREVAEKLLKWAEISPDTNSVCLLPHAERKPAKRRRPPTEEGPGRL